MSSLKFDIGGLDLDKLIRAAEVGGDAGLALATEHVRGVAVEQTPLETGRLAGSGTPTEDRPVNLEHVAGGVRAAIVFEGPYARYQHETMDLHHEHGNAKFLERPIATEEQAVLRIIARQVKDAL